MDVLEQSHVHMKDPEHVKQVIDAIVKEGASKLQIVADFDFTLSKFSHKGVRSPGCHHVLEESNVLSDSYKEAAKKLRDTYYPIETNPKLTIEEKIPHMVQWWTQAHHLLEQTEIFQSYIKDMVSNSSAKLRDGCDMLFDELTRNDIPLMIFSAGIGNILEEVIRQQAKFSDNMHVVSNYMKFDENDKMIGFKEDIIHTFNKNENAVHKSDYFQKLQNRSNIILLGDSLGDLHMADGVPNVKNKLTIGFLNVNVETSLELYKNKWDIVLVQDETLDVANAILRRVLQKTE